MHNLRCKDRMIRVVAERIYAEMQMGISFIHIKAIDDLVFRRE